MTKTAKHNSNNQVKADAYDISAAFRPDYSIFVSANAGAGKTSLLTNRVLSLLLHGVTPSKILCLTFTNAAAAEMSNRVLQELGKWVMASDDTLRTSLSLLLGHPPDDYLIERARSLFATVLEAPEGVRIQTIHSFSQSLLRRFPIEAGISPHFSVMDSRTEQELLKESSMRIYNRAQTYGQQLQESLLAIAQSMSESSVNKLLSEIITHKSRFASLFSEPGAIDAAITRIHDQLHVTNDTTFDALLAKHFSYDTPTLNALRQIAAQLLEGKSTDVATGEKLARWLEHVEGTKGEQRVDDYLQAFMTQAGDIRKRLHTQNTLNESEAETLLAEQQRVLVFHNDLNALRTAESTTHMLHIAEALIESYEKLKRAHGQMDYDDLILTARNLLGHAGITPWVLFKLDGGIDHVLIDEAQDTSPLQWQIVTSVTQEFFVGLGQHDVDRSLFVVGDEKQSIYSFQGADPEALSRMQRFFTRQIEDAQQAIKSISLTRSYRSVQEILTVVDSIFSLPDAKQGVTFDNSDMEHIATRLDHPGTVELWPLMTKDKESDNPLPPSAQLARHIAETIKNWLSEGLWLASEKRHVQPGDIMILVRTRTAFVDQLVRTLKRRSIPVAGHDRMKLGDNLAIQDLIALGQCLLLPEDDLTLAALLKSPIGNISEKQLFELAYGRGKSSLWQCLSRHADKPGFSEAYTLLSELRRKADYIQPYELYSYLLDTLGARKRFVGRMGEEYHEPIDEFLGQALLYERSHTPSLQGFLHWLENSESIIKRDMEQSRNVIRIMTVHGAKGLQAPIVMLPDTMAQKVQKNMLLWQEEERISLPFWPRAKRYEEKVSTGLRKVKHDAELCEYRRQLYVALTRAKDQLYIAGATTEKNAHAQSWYALIKQGLAELPTTAFTTTSGEAIRVGAPPEYRPPVASHTVVSSTAQNSEELAFLQNKAPSEPTPSQPLTPSRCTIDDPASASPITDQGQFYPRGTLIHRLLQYLPELPSDKRAQAADNIALLYQHSLSDSVRDACIAEVLHLIEHPPFDFLFSQDALAEVPLVGCINIKGKEIAVSGQIDRLYIDNETIWIVDFKSGSHMPDKQQDIPSHYLAQMRLYQLLMKRMHPQKTVHCGLLWTAIPKLITLEEALLDEVDLSTYI